MRASWYFKNLSSDKHILSSYAKICFSSLKISKNKYSSTSDLLEYKKSCTKKGHALAFSKVCKLHQNGPKYRLRNLRVFQRMTENFQSKLHKEERKQSKGAKVCASIRREL